MIADFLVKFKISKIEFSQKSSVPIGPADKKKKYYKNT